MSLSKEQYPYAIAAGVTAAVAIGVGIYAYMGQSEPGQAGGDVVEQTSTLVTATEKVDEEEEQEHVHLLRTESVQRGKDVSNVSYKMALALLKGGKTFHGHSIIKFSLTEESCKSDNIFVDYKGSISRLVINGKQVDAKTCFKN